MCGPSPKGILAQLIAMSGDGGLDRTLLIHRPSSIPPRRLAMRYGVRALIGLTTATVVFATACSDATTSPSATAPVFADSSATDANLLGGLLGGVLGTVGNLLATPVHRSQPLANDVSWTFTASPYGSRSSNASVGLSIYVPAGAVDRYTTI